jgi:hypothetical protein
MAVFNSTTDKKVYLDGTNEQTGSNTTTTPVGLNEIAIGIKNDLSAGEQWDGDLAEVFVYSGGSFTTEELLALGQDGVCPLYIRPHQLVFYCPLINTSGNEVDVVGGITMTDTNTVTSNEHPPIAHPAGINVIAGGVINTSILVPTGPWR